MTAQDAPVRPRLRVAVGAAVVLVLVALGAAALFAAMAPRGQSHSVEPAQTMPTASTTGIVILVHVLGAVAHPGLFELPEGARTVDAVAAAGGFLETADQSGLNLARPVSDGEQLYVPSVGEVPPPNSPASPGGKVNLNTADAAALDTLPRIGPATAAHILEWREANGPFTRIEDLLSVPGIGDKTFDGLKELVTV